MNTHNVSETETRRIGHAPKATLSHMGDVHLLTDVGSHEHDIVWRHINDNRPTWIFWGSLMITFNEPEDITTFATYLLVYSQSSVLVDNLDGSTLLVTVAHLIGSRPYYIMQGSTPHLHNEEHGSSGESSTQTTSSPLSFKPAPPTHADARPSYYLLAPMNVRVFLSSLVTQMRVMPGVENVYLCPSVSDVHDVLGFVR